jgi:hypothetical protein
VQDPVLRVRLRGVQLADQLQLGPLGGQVVEEPPSSSEKDGDDVQFHLVELTGP